jgi:hypothetical protein
VLALKKYVASDTPPQHLHSLTEFLNMLWNQFTGFAKHGIAT